MADTGKRVEKVVKDDKEEAVIVEWVGGMRVTHRYRPDRERQLAFYKRLLGYHAPRP